MKYSVNLLRGTFSCGNCKKEFLMFYVNKGRRGYDYWGNRGRFNHRGAKANFNRHLKACYYGKKEKQRC